MPVALAIIWAALTQAQMRERDTALATTVFYFEFDRSDLSAEAREALVYHANRLMENSSLRYRSGRACG